MLVWCLQYYTRFSIQLHAHFQGGFIVDVHRHAVVAVVDKPPHLRPIASTGLSFITFVPTHVG